MQEHGAPAQIYVSNVIVEAALEDVCKLAGVELKRAKRLPGIDEFRQSMGQMRQWVDEAVFEAEFTDTSFENVYYLWQNYTINKE